MKFFASEIENFAAARIFGAEESFES